MTPLEYCKAHAPQRGSSRYYSLLRLDDLQKTAVSVLDALTSELSNIALSSLDAELARNKLNWWKIEISQIYSNKAQHPITIALTPLIDKWNLPESYFHEIIDGVLMDIDGSSCSSDTELALFLYRTGSVPALLAAEIFGYQDRLTLNIIKDLGSILQYSSRLNNLQPLVSQGLLPFSKGVLNDSNIDFSELRMGYTNPKLRSLICSELEATNSRIQAIFTSIPQRDLVLQHPHISASLIHIALNNEVMKDGCALMEHKIKLTPLRKFWIAWKNYQKIRIASPKASLI